MAFTTGLDFAFAGAPFVQVPTKDALGSLDFVFAGQPFMSTAQISGGVGINGNTFVQVFVCT